MSALDTAFETLFFGSGGFLGMLLMVALILMISRIHKYASVFMVPIALLMGFQYLLNTPADNPVMWGFIVMFGIASFLIIDTYQNIK